MKKIWQGHYIAHFGGDQCKSMVVLREIPDFPFKSALFGLVMTPYGDGWKNAKYMYIHTVYLCIKDSTVYCVYCIVYTVYRNVLECSSTTLPKGESSLSIEYQ